MFALPASVRVVLATGPVDMRKSIDGLMALVRAAWGEDVYSGHLFAFVSRKGDRVKVLTWSRGGFVLLYKRLEAGDVFIEEYETDPVTTPDDKFVITVYVPLR